MKIQLFIEIKPSNSNELQDFRLEELNLGVSFLCHIIYYEKTDSKLFFISIYNLYSCALYSPEVRSKNTAIPIPSCQFHEPFIHSYFCSLTTGEGASQIKKTHNSYKQMLRNPT